MIYQGLTAAITVLSAVLILLALATNADLAWGAVVVVNLVGLWVNFLYWRDSRS